MPNNRDDLEREISELKQQNIELSKYNSKLIQSEQRYRLIIEGVRDYAIFMLDPNGFVSSWNEGARRFKGYEAHEIIGKHFSTFYSEGDIQNGKPDWEIETAIANGRVEDEGWRIRKDGTTFWASVVITRINDQNGKILGFSKVTRDLTEKRIVEEALRKSEERFRLMVSAVKDYAIIMLDTEGKIISWNEGAKRIKGYEASEIIGQHFSRFYLPEDIARGHPEEELEIVRREGKFEEESWRVKKDGTKFWANVVITNLIDASGSHVGYVKVTRDLTERKINEEHLKNAYMGLEQRVKDRTKELEIALKTRDEFLSIASHELKTPLTSLKMQLQMSRRKMGSHKETPSPAEMIKSLDMGIRQVDSLSYLVDDLLDISRMQIGVFELSLQEINLSEMVEEVALRFSQQFTSIGSKIDFNLDRAARGLWDRYRIEQILVNLISNAIKYAPGYVLSMSTSFVGNDRIQLIVEDFGPGIAPEKQSLIFDRFERVNTNRNIGGLGLGLFITRRIVEAHQGSIRVESELGKGAKFIVELPVKSTNQAL